LLPVQALEPATVARLIADLDSPRFQVREKASQELEQAGEAVAGALREAKKGGPSAEQGRRIDQLLAGLAAAKPGPEQLRTTRALVTLEQIGGLEARKVLARLAAGAPGAGLTQEAQAALQRLK